jgi:hypothetical protein
MSNIVNKIIDKRFEKGKIYTITCDDGAVYVGSTIRTLNKRYIGHKNNEISSMYKYIEKHYGGDWSKCKIELYDLYPCNSKKELEKKEGEIIRLIGTINKVIAGRGKAEYYKNYTDEILKKNKRYYYSNNKVDILQQHIQYREDNKEKIQNYERNRPNKKERLEIQKEKIECECGCISTRTHLARHQKSPQHQELILNQTTAILSFLECF